MAQALHPRKPLLLVGTALTLLALLVGLFALSTAQSAQAKGRTLFVGLSAGSGTSCAHPGYTSVQAAVDAANTGDTVYLCGANTYSEQVILNKSITLTGDKGATIQAPTSFPATPLSRLPAQFSADNLFVPQAIVIVWGAHVNVTMSRLIVAGTLPGNGGCAEQEFGILVIAGASASLSKDTVQDVRDANTALAGCQFGVGIQVGREYWPTADFSTFKVENFVGHADIDNTTVTSYQKNGITIDGPGSTADVDDSTVNGFGRDAIYGAIIAQNGIQMSRGAKGTIDDSTVTGNSYTGTAPASSTGILIYGGCGDPLVTNVTVKENKLINNDVGIDFDNTTPDCSAPPMTPTRDKAIGNIVRNDAVTNQGAVTLNSTTYNGYQAGIEDVGNRDQIIDNTIAGAGYAPQTTAGGPFVQPIDTTSFPTINPIIDDNTIHV
jgi:hypothetical protein